MTHGVTESATVGFISYTRVDNEDFDGVVDEIRQTLTALFEARTGRKLQLFIDREDIGWGEDWRSKIQISVENAVVFIPVVTLRYFNSQACLDELLAFEAKARELGVTDLILTIVLFGADQISEDDPRPEVQLVARLNYQKFENAWEAGYGSPEWRRAISKCARELAEALDHVESALVAKAETAGGILARGNSAVRGELTPQTADLPDDFDITVMGERLDDVTAALETATSILTELGEVAKGAFGDDFSSLSPGQSNARILTAARNMKDPSLRLEAAGKIAEQKLLDLDPQLRTLVRELADLDLPEAQEQLIALLKGMTDDDGSMAETEGVIDQFIQMIRFVSLTNVAVRKSLQPALRGTRSLLSAIRVFRGWESLVA